MKFAISFNGGYSNTILPKGFYVFPEWFSVFLLQRRIETVIYKLLRSFLKVGLPKVGSLCFSENIQNFAIVNRELIT